MFQYGAEIWHKLDNATLRVFAEYADLTSYWWTGDPRTRNISYGHHIYKDGYRYRGRPIGHWADQDSQILSFGGIIAEREWNRLGFNVLRTGDLNEDGTESQAVVFPSVSVNRLLLIRCFQFSELSCIHNCQLILPWVGNICNQQDATITD